VASGLEPSDHHQARRSLPATLLIHGARSVLHHAKHNAKPDRLRVWALACERLCILDATGQVLVHRNLPAKAEAFREAVAPYRDDLVVACECI
jgi:hypothetical protein